jgi:protein-L-isoaspartate(D-aspartate) O-methyltransferase
MDDYDAERHRMVEGQLRSRGLRDERLLGVFEQVPRHLFVPERERERAYADSPLPIGYDQTISQPYIVALMLSLLDLHGDERVLEIGTGSGYEAALLGKLAAEVHTVELLPELGQQADVLLQELGYTNVHVHIGDGSLGWPDEAPYAGIVGAAAAPQVPAPLLEQLSDGGRLVLPVAEGHDQYLKTITRSGNAYAERIVTAVAFVPMRGKHGWN